MRIINPIDLTESGVAGSNAPGDGHAEWATIGRDFLTEISNPLVSANESLLFVADGSGYGIPVYAFDLATGAQVDLPIDDRFIDVREIAASPDGSFLAVKGYVGSDQIVRVYSLVTGVAVFESPTSVSFTSRHSYIGWSPDSLIFSFHGFDSTDRDSPTSVSVGAWSNPSSIPDVEAMFAEYPEGRVSASWAFRGICASDSGTYYTLSTSEFFDVWIGTVGPPTRYVIRKTILGRIDPSGANSFFELKRTGGNLSLTPELTAPENLFHNPIKGHVLSYYENAFYAFDDATFAPDTDVPPPPPAAPIALAPSLDGTEFTVINASVQPYAERYDSTTYTVIGSLDAAIGGRRTPQISYSSDYIAFASPAGGYGLIERTDYTRVDQVNPTVTAGDIYTYANHNYEALQDNNDRPDLGVLNLDAEGNPNPTWLDLGFINPLRMIDGKLDSLTTAEGSLTITINPNTFVNGLSLFNVTSETVQITVTSPDHGVVYDTGELSLRDNSAVMGWYDYFFSRRPAKKDLARIDLPTYPDATITVTLSGSGTVSIGEVVAGRLQVLGDTRQGSSIGIIDNSTKERDEFGDFVIVERRSSKRAEYDVIIQRAATSGVHRILDGYRTKPIVYIGDINEEALTVYGFFIDFQINYESSCVSLATITVEGL